jgi:hypothetical protein
LGFSSLQEAPVHVNEAVAASNTSTATADHGDPRLRRELVSMLFALAVSQVAIYAYSVTYAELPAPVSSESDTGLWRTAAFAHLAVALMVIATSWIGWSKSKAADQPVDRVFDPDFISWLADILLVVFYFFIASSVEVKPNPSGGNSILIEPSFREEYVWVGFLLVTYGIWDFASKCIRNNNVKWLSKQWLCNSFACCFSSILAVSFWVAMGMITAWGRETPRAISPSAIDVILLDAALMLLVVAFRVAKSAEAAWFASKLKWRVRPTSSEPEPLWSLKLILLITGFAALILATGWF